MKKRYTVFISSTYEDLKEERQAVIYSLLKLDLIPCGMELFPASSEEQWSLIKRMIDDCDYYILILAGRYGSTNKDGMGYTELEYQYALQQKKPIASFLYKNPENLPMKKFEKSIKKQKMLMKFRRLTEQQLVNYWESPEELSLNVMISMARLIEQFPANGWVKADSNLKAAKDFMGLNAIYKSRQYMNRVLNNVSMINTLDVCAFGLRSFRDMKAKEIQYACANGLKIRYLTISPNSIFLKQREKEENVIQGEIAHSIRDCIDFFIRLDMQYPGSAVVKTYDALPLNLYWRQDDYLATGPYLFGKTSQLTITYEFTKGSDGFLYYENYFDELWNNDNFCHRYKS